MSVRVLITGANGFIGSFLAKHLTMRGYSVETPLFDITKQGETKSALEKLQWDVLVHLAGISAVPVAEKDPDLAFMTNVYGPINVATCAWKLNPKTHFIFSSTAQVYSIDRFQNALNDVVFDENSTLGPKNKYAETKLFAERLLTDFVQRHGMALSILRLFNHSHKNQSQDFFMPYIYNQLVNAKGDEPIPVGNLDLERDIGGISDLLCAFESIVSAKARHQQVEIFNVCSGRPRRLRTLAGLLAMKLGKKCSFEIDSEKIRTNELKSLCGSFEKLKSKTGWYPLIISDQDLVNSFLED